MKTIKYHVIKAHLYNELYTTCKFCEKTSLPLILTIEDTNNIYSNICLECAATCCSNMVLIRKIKELFETVKMQRVRHIDNLEWKNVDDPDGIFKKLGFSGDNDAFTHKAIGTRYNVTHVEDNDQWVVEAVYRTKAIKFSKIFESREQAQLSVFDHVHQVTLDRIVKYQRNLIKYTSN